MSSGTRASMTPEESLALIKHTLGLARRELMLPDGPLARIWGVVVLVSLAAMYIARVTPLSRTPVIAVIAVAAVWVLAVLGGTYFSGRLAHSFYASTAAAGGGLRAQVMERMPLIWAVGVAIAIATGIAAGQNLDGVIAVVAFYAAALYFMSGLLCFDNVELGTGLWIGIANVISLLITRLNYPLAQAAYPLAMAVLVGGGLVVSGFVDDRKWAGVTALADA